MSAFTVLIPARLKSTRLPGKPLADIAGKPMVVRVAERALAAGASRVVVALDDASVEAACRVHGIETIMTRPDHLTGTDRLSEAVSKLGLHDDEIVVNVQGDEPLMPVEVIRSVAGLLAERDCAIATAAHPITDIEAFMNPNVVKVALDSESYALTFSRAPLPYPRDHFRDQKPGLPADLPAYHHLGIYAYRVKFLKRFPTLEQPPLERYESLEQLRALFYGERIVVKVLNEDLPAGVDTPEDLERVRAHFCRQ